MTKQLITFEIADKRLGVDIMAIREIRAWTPPTPIPHAPAFVRGIVNLGGLETRFNGGDGSSHLVNSPDVVPRQSLHLVGQ